MKKKHYSDIVKQTWFDRLMPNAIYHYARLARWDRPVGVWLLFIPCLWGMFMGLHTVRLEYSQIALYTVLFFIGSLVMRGAGCIINDIIDRDLDKKIERTQDRPLASGQLSKRQAFVFLALHLIIGLVILCQFNGATIVLGFLSLPLVVTYPLMKRITWWPQAFLGITFNWGILMGGAAVTNTMIAPDILWLYGAAICWTIAYDTIYAFQDIADDALIGIKSTARLFGKNAKRYITLFYVLMLIGLIMAGQGLPNLSRYYAPLMAFIIAAQFYDLWWCWDQNDQRGSLRAFKRHIGFGWAIAVTIFLNFVLTV